MDESRRIHCSDEKGCPGLVIHEWTNSGIRANCDENAHFPYNDGCLKKGWPFPNLIH